MKRLYHATILGLVAITGPAPFARSEPTAKDPDTQALSALLKFQLDTKDFQKSMNMKEFLELLAKKVAPLELPIVVNVKAFKEENPDAPDIHDTEISFPPFPRRQRLETLLRQALLQAKPPNATFVLRDGIIEITTLERTRAQSLLRTLLLSAQRAASDGGLIDVDPALPVPELLPPTVKAIPRPPLFNEDLAKAPEVSLLDAPKVAVILGIGQPATLAQLAGLEITNQVARIRHLNKDVTDGFLKTVIDKRADLRGLSFKMGDECREVGDRAKLFSLLAALVRHTRAEVMAEAEQALLPLKADKFWSAFQNHNRDIKDKLLQMTGCSGETYEAAAVAALIQILEPESVAVRRGLVKHLAGTLHADATQALARLALFAPEEEVRRPALVALKLRRERDYNAILLEAFRYPLPVVARRAAEAAVRLERNDLLPQLVALLDEADPRLPVVREIDGKRTSVVREVVRVNHHRNCLLCHEPFVSGEQLDDFQALSLATIPLPISVKATEGMGYMANVASSNESVRIDVTYLRQDFSLMQPVHEAERSSSMQRFDFLVRTRVLSDDEVEEYKRHEGKTRIGGVTPYQRAVLHALRELTGRDAAPTSQAWRSLVGLGEGGSRSGSFLSGLIR